MTDVPQGTARAAGLVDRRRLLFETGGGLGGLALCWLLGRESAAATDRPADAPPHHPPRARSIINIFLCGGVSHVDTFDYKPDLEKYDGRPMTGKGPVDTFFADPGNLMKSRWPFRQHGRSGLWVSDLLPHLAAKVDRLAVIRSMVARNNNHTPATFMMNTGFTMNGYPSMGSWISYGLGSANADLPAFVVLPDPRQLPAGGSINWTAGFLPASHQGVPFRTKGAPILDLTPAEPIPAAVEEESRALLSRINRAYGARHGTEGLLEARIRSYELAARMQLSVPEAVRVESEPEHTRRLYGLDDPVCGPFARNCLLARRLVERGVRFVQLYDGGAFGAPRVNWDAHEDIASNHGQEARIMDRPVAGLLQDLELRGMLDDTLVCWTTEFGRTPFTQGKNKPGRDHHQHVFTCWLSGAGVRRGIAHGESDDVGYKAGRDPVSIHDLHATILHLLGIDHKRLTYYHNGVRRRLTDVEGEVVHALLA